MRTLQEIEARLSEIAAEIEKRGAEFTADEIAAFDKEVTELKTERKQILEKAELREKLLKDVAEGRSGGGVKTIPHPALGGGQNTVGVITVPTDTREADPFDTVEYRKAFMNYACRGVPIPAEMRANQVSTVANDVGAVVPKITLTEIIRKLESYGGLYARVRKINISAGVEVPILTLKPSASWVGEGASESQKLEAKTTVSFSYFGLECKIAQTLLATVVTFDEFQREFVPLATEAIIKALEIGIVKGTGTGQMKGVIVDNRVPTVNVVTISPAEFGTWKGWKQKVFSKIPKAYRNGIFVMAQGTFDAHIDGMVDTTGQPIGRVNYGIDSAENYRFGGKVIETVEEDVIASYDSAASGDVIAIYLNPRDYAINSSMQMTVVEWTDHDTNKKFTKAQIICDGKLLDASGVLIIKKGGS